MAENSEKMCLLWETKCETEMQASIKRSSSNTEKIIPMNKQDKRKLQQTQLLKRNVSIASSGSAHALVLAGVGGSAEKCCSAEKY